MAIVLTEKQTAIWKCSPNLSPKANVKMLLTKLACFRQATIDATTLELYSSYLASENLVPLQIALARLAEKPRGEGETAFPELGRIIAEIKELDGPPAPTPAGERMAKLIAESKVTQ